MNIIEPSVELVDDFDAAAIMRKLERAGRVCYKSEGNIKPDSAEIISLKIHEFGGAANEHHRAER